MRRLGKFITGAVLTCLATGSALAGEVLSEDFEDGILDQRISIETIGSFTSDPGIQDITNFGSTKAFGFGLSTCGASCFDNYVTSFLITLEEPTYISYVKFKEMELRNIFEERFQLQPKKIDKVCWFHLTRTLPEEGFNEGILPLSKSLEKVWDSLVSLLVQSIPVT